MATEYPRETCTTRVNRSRRFFGCVRNNNNNKSNRFCTFLQKTVLPRRHTVATATIWSPPINVGPGEDVHENENKKTNFLLRRRDTDFHLFATLYLSLSLFHPFRYDRCPTIPAYEPTRITPDFTHAFIHNHYNNNDNSYELLLYYSNFTRSISTIHGKRYPRQPSITILG